MSSAPLCRRDERRQIFVFPTPGGGNKILTNDFPSGTFFHSLSFTGGTYNVAGNAMALGAGGITSTAPIASMNMQIQLAASQTWSAASGFLSVNGGLPGINLGGQTLTLDATAPAKGTASWIVGSGTIVKSGGGEWSLSGNSSFTGQVVVNAGTLSTGGPAALGVSDNSVANGTIVNPGGTLSLSFSYPAEYVRLSGRGPADAGALAGNGSLDGTVELSGLSVLIRGGIALNGMVIGNAPLAFSGSLTLSNPANSFTGPLQWDPSAFSSLRLGADNAVPAGTVVSLPPNGTFDLFGHSQTIASLDGTGRLSLGNATPGTLTITNPAFATLRGYIDGDGTIHQTGGSLTLAAIVSSTNCTYELNGGSLLLNGGVPPAMRQTAGVFRIAGHVFVKSADVRGGTFEPAGGTDIPFIDVLTLSPGATYSALIDAQVPANAGIIEAGTRVDLGGSTLRIAGNVAGLTRFYSVTLIEGNAGLALSGTFAGAAQDAPFAGPGGFDYAVRYAGNSAYPVTLAVLGKPTSTTLTSSANPSNAGDKVTFTATVLASSAPGGTVAFMDDADELAVVPVSAGVATYSTTALRTGSHSIQARYSGTDIFRESASLVLAQSVLATGTAPVVDLAVDPPTILTGGSSTLIWSTTLATSVTIDNGVGAQALSGSVVVQPAETTTYTLTATGPGGTTVRQATVTVQRGRHRAVSHGG